MDVLILAGGGGRRLGGVSKADLLLGGRRLLDHLLDDLAQLRDDGAQIDRVVLVGPEAVSVPPGVLRTLEDPPDGGPAAGLGAGLAALDDPAADGLVAVLACDAPHAVRALGLLRARFGSDGAVARAADGRPQHLLGVYSQAALRRRIADEAGARNLSVGRLVAPLALTVVELPAAYDRDVDTWDDLAALRHTDDASREPS